MTETNEGEAMMIKANEAAKAIRAIKVEKINEIIEAKAGAEKGVNSEIRISIIIFIMKESFAKRVSTRERVFKIIKNFVNMLLIKRLCDIYVCEKTFFNLLKCEQCDINYVVI